MDANPLFRKLLAGALLWLFLPVGVGCDKATLGDGMAGGLPGEDFHGAGWAEAGRHGIAFMADTGSCGSCHGEKLKGGASAVSCEACHAQWEGDCTFCHGGMDNDTGAPPFGVKGEGERRVPGVGAHSAHVEDAESHVAFPCDACHGRLFASYVDDGHLDGGRVAAEVRFSGVSGDGAMYERGSATCSQLYCHGDGQTRSGSIDWMSEEPLGCDACHGDQDNPDEMSGWHGLHLRLNRFGCEACHAPVLEAGGRFLDRALHVNGRKEVGLEDGSYDPETKTCATSCHETAGAWSGGIHPEGWDDPTKHGHAFFLDMDSCRNCHGTLLQGGGSGISCDSCHPGGTPAWRSDCTFCHGGLDNATGAPPRGAHGETGGTFAAVGAHTAHVQDTDLHDAYDCTLCHSKPAFFDDPGHIDTNNGAEMRFAAPAGAWAAYSPWTTQCDSVYCHGDGRTASGPVDWTADVQLGCDGCHGYTSNPGALSGEHDPHIREGLRCRECHVEVVSSTGGIINKAYHTNGSKNVSFLRGGEYNPATRSCDSLSCHDGERW